MPRTNYREIIDRTINTFGEALVTNIVNLIPTNTFFYGSPPYRIVVCSFLIHLETRYGYEKLESFFGVPHSSLKQWFGCLRRILYGCKYPRHNSLQRVYRRND